MLKQRSVPCRCVGCPPTDSVAELVAPDTFTSASFFAPSASDNSPLVARSPNNYVMKTLQTSAALAVLLCAIQAAIAGWDPKATGKTLAEMCPGNLVVNGDFELPNTESTPTELPDPSSNSRWGWYKKIPGTQQ